MKCVSLTLITFLLFACKLPKESNSSQKVKYVLTSNVNKTYVKNFHKGLRLKMSARFNEAIECFKICIDSDAQKDAPHHALSECYLAISDYQNAITHTEKAAELDPQNIHYLQELAYMHKELKNYDKSASCFKKLLKHNPNNLGYLYDYASVLSLSGKIADAIKALDKFETIHGPSTQIAITKFQLYSSLNKDNEAINTLNKAIEIIPSNSKLISTLFEYYIIKNNFEEAQDMLKKIVNENPENGQAQHLLGELYESDKKKQLAFSAYKACLLGKYALDKKIILLDRLIKENNEDLLFLIDNLLEKHPDNANLLALKGNYYLINKHKIKALNSYKQSIKNDPAPYSIWHQIFILENELKLYKDLYEDTKEATSLFPSNALILFYNGISAKNLNKFDYAIQALENGILYHINETTGIQLWEYKFHLAEAYIGINEIQMASRIIKEAYRSNPDEAKLILKNALLLAYLKTDLDMALELTNKLIIDNKPCAIINLKGYILFQQQKYNIALELLENILNMNQCKSKTIELIGDCYFKLGDKTKALNSWKKSRDLGRKDKTLIKKINDKMYYELMM